MRLTHTNAATNTLVKLLLWWDGLTRIQQRMPESKEFLVDSAEKAILLQHDAFVTGALASLRDAIGKKRQEGFGGNGEDGAGGEGGGANNGGGSHGMSRSLHALKGGSGGGGGAGDGGQLGRSQRAHSM